MLIATALNDLLKARVLNREAERRRERFLSRILIRRSKARQREMTVSAALETRPIEVDSPSGKRAA